MESKPLSYKACFIATGELEWYGEGDVAGKRVGRVAHVFIWGGIGGWWGVYGTDVFRQLRGEDVDEIRVYISSWGGSIKEGFEIHNLLKSHKAKVWTHIFGVCASSGTIISAAGDKRTSTSPGVYMIHEGASNIYGSFSELELETMAKSMKIFNGQLRRVYTDLTGKGDDEVAMLMKHEEWYSPDGAVENGFLTGVENVEIPFHFAGVSEEEMVDYYGEETNAEAVIMKVAELGYVANGKFSNKNSIINNRTMNFLANVKGFLNQIGLSLVKDGKEITEQDVKALATDENKAKFLGDIQEDIAESAQQMVADAMADEIQSAKDEAVAEAKAEMKKQFDTLTGQFKDLENKFISNSSGKSGDQGGDGNGLKVTGEKSNGEEEEGAFGSQSRLARSLVAQGGLKLGDLDAIKARVKKKREEMGKR